MKLLEKSVRKNGFTYNLIKRTENVAIYEQVDNVSLDKPFTTAYEVFIIKNKDDVELFPSNKCFGETAWTYTVINEETDKEQSFKKAFNKFELLCSKYI